MITVAIIEPCCIIESAGETIKTPIPEISISEVGTFCPGC